LASIIREVDAGLVVVSYNNESWVAIEELETACRARGGAVATLAFESRRYVGAQIGIHSPAGKKVGQVSHLRNVEYVVCAGERALVDRIANEGDDLWKLPATSRS
jgi:adenine-specific DNA-methyltransferase